MQAGTKSKAALSDAAISCGPACSIDCRRGRCRRCSRCSSATQSSFSSSSMVERGFGRPPVRSLSPIQERHLPDSAPIRARIVKALPHRWGKSPQGIALEGDELRTPVIYGVAVRPGPDLEQVHEDEFEVALNRMQLRQPHVLDLLDDMLPVHFVHPLAARDAAQQAGLVFRPGGERRGCRDRLAWRDGIGCRGAAPFGSVAEHDRAGLGRLRFRFTPTCGATSASRWWRTRSGYVRRSVASAPSCRAGPITCNPAALTATAGP